MTGYDNRIVRILPVFDGWPIAAQDAYVQLTDNSY